MTRTDSDSLRGRTNFTESEVKEIFERAKVENDDHCSDNPCRSVSKVLHKYMHKDERKEDNILAWGAKQYENREGETVEDAGDALRKIVFDAEFYAPGNWKIVREVAARSVYTDFGIECPAVTLSY